MVNYLQNQNDGKAAVCFIYFNHKRQKDQTIPGILGSLLRQIFETQSQASSIIEDFYKKYSKQNTHFTDGDLQDILSRGFATFDKAYIVLDALDEYSSNFEDKIIQDLFGVLLSLGSHVKIMATSRVLGGMEGIFKKIEAKRLEIYARDDDIQLYIKDRVAKELSFVEHLIDIIVHKITQAAKSR
jgi:hypothetical protein